MTDQTRWGIPEVHIKNKMKKFQDDNFSAAVSCAERLSDENLNYLINKLEDIKKDRIKAHPRGK